LLAFLSTVRWQDIADIALTSYILFRFYVLFRGTTVFRVITGIALLGFFQRVAVSLGLIVTSWVMQGFTAVAALIIIIVFRNEIRNVLQARNLHAIFWGTGFKRQTAPVESIVQAIYDLSRQRIGALLVIPGVEDLEDVVQRGIPWQGLATREAIKTVFWPDNPVHDGAAVLQGSRIAEVGVILPLSHRENLPSAYGTRHRAALGLTEVTDSMVVVVSEESGRVSLVKNGRIDPIADNVELSRRMREHLGIVVGPTRRQKREKVKLVAAAVCSVLLITGVWFSFTRGLDTLITLEVPVEYVKRDPKMEILDTSVNTVSLQLRGSESLIRSLKPEQVKVRLNLSGAAMGENTFTLTSENIVLPPGVFLDKVKPPAVHVTLDVPVARSIPVQVDWAGRLDPELRIEFVSVEPDRVRVEGGSGVLEALSTLYTRKVPLAKIVESGSMTVELALPPASVEVAPDEPEEVTVTYTVKKRQK
jgi:diadenylate cyclase